MIRAQPSEFIALFVFRESDLPYESGTSGDDETCPSDLTHPEVKVKVTYFDLFCRLN